MLVAGLLALVLGASPLFPVDLPEDEDDEYVRELVAALEARPIDINRCRAEDLLAIPWLDPALAWRIVAWRDSAGAFRSVGELAQVPGMTDDWLRLVVPYVRVGTGEAPLRASARLTTRTDTVPPAAGRWAGSAALALARGPWSVLLTAENDIAEPVLPDWFGAAAAWQSGPTRACAGDFTFGSGLGLVFSGPHRRFADRAGLVVRGPDNARPLAAPLESRALRGLAAEHAFGRWTVAGFGSWARRDAVLGDDGSVTRLRLDGRHDDSASVAGRRAVEEYAGGGHVTGTFGRARAGVSVGHVGYAPGIAPAESVGSFAGRSLSFGGVGLDWLGRPYRLALELAGSTGGGLAGAAAVEGHWREFRLSVGMDARQARYFAPLGRWQSTSGCRDRVSARGSVRWTPGGFSVGASVSSYQDYLVDSLPGRVGLDAAVPLGPVRLALGIERRYRLDEPRFRRAHASLRWQPLKRLGLAAEFDDGYPEGTEGRGRALALRLETGTGPLAFEAAAARFDASSGARMYFTDPAVFGPARSWSTAAAGWRFAGAAGVKLPFGRIGLGIGRATGAESGWDAALRLEAGTL